MSLFKKLRQQRAKAYWGWHIATNDSLTVDKDGGFTLRLKTEDFRVIGGK